MDIDSHPTPTPPAEGDGSQDVEVVTAADLRAGDRVVMDGDVVVVESVMRSGDRVYVRADGVPVSALADAMVERLARTHESAPRLRGGVEGRFVVLGAVSVRRRPSCRSSPGRGG